MPGLAGVEALRSGEAHLAAARWHEALHAFREAVVADGAPEAYEGLSWAAWWLDLADVVLDARGQAFRGYGDRGDHLGAARMAVWLGADSLDFHGAASVAGGWFGRAHRLLDGLPEGPEHGWLAFHEGYVATGTDTLLAMRLAERARQIGDADAVPDLQMLGLALRGSCRVGRGEITAGMRDLDEAQTMTGEATLPIAAAWTSCFLVSSCLSVVDLGRAFEWCDVIERFAERYGSRYMLAFCRAEYGVVHLWRGEWAAAEKVLVQAVEDFEQSRPAMVGGPLTALAELRGRQGRHPEARELLARAGATAGALECAARWELTLGHERRARELAERALRARPADREVDRLPLLETLARTRALCEDAPAARAAVEELSRAAAQVGGGAALALAALAAGSCAMAEGRYDAARLLLEDAADGFARSGAPYEAARARVELAAALLALRRATSAAAEARAALDVLESLGAAPAAGRARRLVESAAEPDSALVTPREREVLELLAEGLTNRQIADRLVVSEHTVHRHVTNILRKLGLPSRAAAAAHAARSDLGAPRQPARGAPR